MFFTKFLQFNIAGKASSYFNPEVAQTVLNCIPSVTTIIFTSPLSRPHTPDQNSGYFIKIDCAWR